MISTALALALLLSAADAGPPPAALATAESAIAEARAAGATDAALATAHDALQKARAAQAAGKAEDAKRLADEAWDAARKAKEDAARAKPEHTKFHVGVEDETTTNVRVDEGGPVELDSGADKALVRAGQGARVKKGQKIALTTLPRAPALLAPKDGALVQGKRDKAGAPVAVTLELAWSPVAGAERYEVVVSRDREGKRVFARGEAREPRLVLTQSAPPAEAFGVYFWRVRAVAGGASGRPSEARRLTVTDKPPTLEIQKPVWK